MDISKYFWESLGIRDNKSRLYVILSKEMTFNLERTLFKMCTFNLWLWVVYE